MPSTTHHPLATTPPGGPVVWTGAYVVLTAALVVAGGLGALYALTSSLVGLGPALAVVLVELAVVAAAPTVVRGVLQSVCTRVTERHPTTG